MAIKYAYHKKAGQKQAQQKPTSNQPLKASTANKLYKMGISMPCNDGEAKEIRLAGRRVF